MLAEDAAAHRRQLFLFALDFIVPPTVLPLALDWSNTSTESHYLHHVKTKCLVW
jgi:hypothetical protein